MVGGSHTHGKGSHGVGPDVPGGDSCDPSTNIFLVLTALRKEFKAKRKIERLNLKYIQNPWKSF